MNSKRHFLLFLLLTFLAAPAFLWATHNRAGEIHIRQIGPLTIEATIITWTKASSINADRDTLTICWGDFVCEAVNRSNGPNDKGVVWPGDIKYNLYVARHTYAGPATFRISMTDPNRIAGILNVNPPSSENIPFHLETVYSFQDPQFGGSNTTPYLLQPPIDQACKGKPFKHNPNAYDPDGDSLSYEFIVPLQSVNTPVPNYSFPNFITPGPNNNLSINRKTGDILWTSPQRAGEYNLAFIIISWRDGAPIDTTVRDMQILVETCDNNPPVVETIDKICVVAGNLVKINVRGTDPDAGDKVQLTAIGAPLSQGAPGSNAIFTVSPTGFSTPPVNGIFTWTPPCEQISDQAYTVVFKAVDSSSVGVPKLADLKTVEIKVVGPAPEDVKATAQMGKVEVSWEKPYFCDQAANNYFFGFSVWRREGSNPFVPDTCQPGLAGRGYTELTFITKDSFNGRYIYQDTAVERGRTYCYRILAKFARISGGGYPYNIVESLPSEEVCVQLPRDLPLITNVSVINTDPATGQMQVCWSKPVGGDLDTIINPGPYRYQLLRGDGFGPGTLTEVPGASFVAAQFWQANDTCFTDVGLNTNGIPYHYMVAFYVRGENTPLGSSNEASSLFLNINSTDQTNILSWSGNIPWNNYRYDIYRQNETSGLFELLSSTTTPTYEDRGLINGKQYCYFVRSEGTYSIGGVINPIFNNSQENCGVPIDTVPPCAPKLTIHNLCDDPQYQTNEPPYTNALSWTNPNVQCDGSDDAVAYRIWYAADKTVPLSSIQQINGATNLQFKHLLPDGLAGCYAVSAIDSVGNESVLSDTICVDNCPEYRLPNAFTPNGDDKNDLFTPFPGWRFIERVDFQVFNRWGNAVFQTSDPNLNWAGRDAEGKALSDGTYFYVCKIYEKRVDGVVLRSGVLSGYIELIAASR
ncbi:MAG: gliding motility-associated C-terminal domain-containing protein [Saprospiraceae bacterium]